jgi:hypothetical protein
MIFPGLECEEAGTLSLHSRYDVDRLEVLAEYLGRVYQHWRHSFASTIAYMLAIGCVSLYDMILTVRYAGSLKYLEQNPIGRWIMGLDQLQHGCHPDLTVFLMAKGIGTVLVMASLCWILRRNARIGHPIGLGVSTFQLLLAMYLSLATVSSEIL